MADLHLVPNSHGRLTLPSRPRGPWRLPTYSPTALNQHANCPEAFLHERVLKTTPAEDQSREALAKGSAVHALLERYVGLDPTARTRFAASLAGEAARVLAAQGMPATSPGHAAAVAEVVACAANGIDVLQTKFAGALVLVGEQFLDLRWDRPPAPFRLTAKVDLLAVFPDGSVESLDWKTGAARGLDQLQNVICRLVTEANASQIFAAHLPSGRPTAIRTTVCHLGTRTMSVQEFDHPQLVAEFSDIRARIVGIEQAKANPTPGSMEWRPQPGPLCGWCKYAHACSYYAAPSADGVMAWLDDAPALSL